MSVERHVVHELHLGLESETYSFCKWFGLTVTLRRGFWVIFAQ